MGTFFPCPQELQDTVAGGRAAGTPEAKDLEIQENLNVSRYGYKNWYDWQCANWGTKWDVGRREYYDKVPAKRGAEEITLSFESAWAPPLEFYNKMEVQHGFIIHARYFEPGCGFIGEWVDGADNAWDFSGFDSDKEALEFLLENAPAALIDDFGIEDWLSGMPDPDDEDADE